MTNKWNTSHGNSTSTSSNSLSHRDMSNMAMVGFIVAITGINSISDPWRIDHDNLTDQLR